VDLFIPFYEEDLLLQLLDLSAVLLDLLHGGLVALLGVAFLLLLAGGRLRGGRLALRRVPSVLSHQLLYCGSLMLQFQGFVLVFLL
jgi:hypothetical protein